MCYACYIPRYADGMETISQRELRNRSADILRAVRAGEAFQVTNDGTPVARIVPLRGAPIGEPDRPAIIRGGFSELPRHAIRGSTALTLEEIREG